MDTLSIAPLSETAFSNLLQDTSVKPIDTHYYILIIFAWGLLVGVISRMLAPGVAAVGVLGLVIFYLSSAQYQFNTHATWYPVVIPLFLQAPLGFFGAVLWDYFEMNKERQNLRKVLRSYVPDDVLEELAKNIVDLKRGDQSVYGACLYTDIKDYTALAEKMGARELNTLMGEYRRVTLEPVKQNGGQVIDLVGDSMLAIWKTSGSDAEMRKQACLAAIGVAKAVREFNQSFEAVKKLPTRVGVHVGPIFLGHVGAEKEYRYGARGDTVNTASRMDGLNKYLGTEILVSEEVIRDLDGFLNREVGKFRLKGKAQPIVVHELLCRIEERDEKQIRTCAIFVKALQAFRRQSWDEAKKRFQRMKKSGEYGLSNYYLRLCEQYKKNPPGEGWDGVIELEEK